MEKIWQFLIKCDNWYNIYSGEGLFNKNCYELATMKLLNSNNMYIQFNDKQNAQKLLQHHDTMWLATLLNI